MIYLTVYRDGKTELEHLPMADANFYLSGIRAVVAGTGGENFLPSQVYYMGRKYELNHPQD